MIVLEQRLSKMTDSTKKVYITTKGHLEWDEALGQYIAVSDEGYEYEGPLALAHNNPALDIDIYRWRDDDGSETTATWLAAANTGYNFDVSAGNVQARLRVDISESGGANASNQAYELQFSINGSAFTTLGTATTGVRYYDSANLTNNTDTTEQLNGGGTFTGTGGQCEDGIVDGFVIGANEDLEAEYTVEFVSADLSNNDVITFQILGSVDGVITATVTPTTTIIASSAVTEVITKGTWPAWSGQVLQAQNLITIAADVWPAWSGQVLQAQNLITVTAATWPAWSGQAFNINAGLIETIAGGTWQPFVGQVFSVTEPSVTEVITAGSWSFTEQALQAKVTAIVSKGTWQPFTGQIFSINDATNIDAGLANFNYLGGILDDPTSANVTEVIAKGNFFYTGKIVNAQNVITIGTTSFNTVTQAVQAQNNVIQAAALFNYTAEAVESSADVIVDILPGAFNTTVNGLFTDVSITPAPANFTFIGKPLQASSQVSRYTAAMRWHMKY